VDQEKVEIVEPELVETGVEGFERVVIAVLVVPQLGRDEQFVAGQRGILDGPAHALFVEVELGGVDAAIAGFERRGHRPLRLIVRDLPDAEAELRDKDAVVQGDVGNAHVRTTPS
jgi:hypothetical protein